MTSEFGVFLRQARKRKSLGQEELARDADVSVRTVRRLEAGDHSRPQFQTVQRLAHALDLGPADRETFLRTAGFPEADAVIEPVGEFGELLRQVRKQKSLTQERLADRAEVSVRTVRRLESGDALGLVVDTVRQLADALGLRPGSAERDSFLRAAVDGRA
ncbi:helix-turn-helix domain-containing protein [Amycolatopsis nalaikhensis]|uniref:Helix-turn-helix transcriptional regulator n=1 Tax=Amycolatopsis nalaikhensis TaxID=715472 RepID=A0ABY8XJS7_9PSEU|nr:helix-turn-helix transcriptional regulator [Amycolatopsis sp. 2-2]WIV55895.1 helix-turn-helix transcriptional regulator [Amycolatopsis sp. 2-2]